jgi:hypothetical protein
MLRQGTSCTRLLNSGCSLTNCSNYKMLEALVNSRKQVIQDGLNDINSVNLDNATNSFTLLASSSNSKGFLDNLLNNIISFTLLAIISSTLMVTLQATIISFIVLATTTSSIVLATTKSSTLLAAIISFLLLVSNSYNKGLLDTKIKCTKKTSSIKLKTKQLKQKREKNIGDRVHSVSRSQNPTLFRHKCII